MMKLSLLKGERAEEEGSIADTKGGASWVGTTVEMNVRVTIDGGSTQGSPREGGENVECRKEIRIGVSRG